MRSGWSVRKLGLGMGCAGLLMVGCEGTPDTANSSAPVPSAPANGSTAPSESTAEFQETPSGLRYRVLKEAAGKKPKPENTVTVNYRGWLDNGKEFDSGNGITFGLGQVIAGWTEGLQLVGEGGAIELEIPANLAYGDQALPGIPAGSTLHFHVDLLKVE